MRHLNPTEWISFARKRQDDKRRQAHPAIKLPEMNSYWILMKFGEKSKCINLAVIYNGYFSLLGNLASFIWFIKDMI